MECKILDHSKKTDFLTNDFVDKENVIKLFKILKIVSFAFQ